MKPRITVLTLGVDLLGRDHRPRVRISDDGLVALLRAGARWMRADGRQHVLGRGGPVQFHVDFVAQFDNARGPRGSLPRGMFLSRLAAKWQRVAIYKLLRSCHNDVQRHPSAACLRSHASE